ncbi:MAG: LD-carboxypeptidase [Bacteroidales bacterium]|nr:LD-carboxypeptidase [Bacteroidales bacterium]
MNRRIIIPPFLEKGDRIAMISPASVLDDEIIRKAQEIIWDWGYEPVLGPNVGKVDAGKYAGTPSERADDVIWAYTDPSIKAILCNRGGYGLIHLVDMIPPTVFTSSPKWMVGFSDVTTLLSMSASAGVASLHATMPSLFSTGGQDELSASLLRGFLEGKVPSYRFDGGDFLKEGYAEGILLGGNICTFAPLLAAKQYFTPKKDIILFIEDVEETFHNIDRQFFTLKLSGLLDQVKGVIVGDFTDCIPDLGYGSIAQMLWERYLRDMDIPVCCGFPAGHDKRNVPLIEGANVRLSVKEGDCSLSFDVKGEEFWVDLRGE